MLLATLNSITSIYFVNNLNDAKRERDKSCFEAGLQRVYAIKFITL